MQSKERISLSNGQRKRSKNNPKTKKSKKHKTLKKCQPSLKGSHHPYVKGVANSVKVGMIHNHIGKIYLRE
jgi:hypothetical protein